MSYHKKNLKEKLAEIAWDICDADSWQKVNMRLVAKKAGVSTTASYRHYKNKNDLKAEIMRRGFQQLHKDIKKHPNYDGLTAYGAHYIRFGLQHPNIYDLLFGNIDIDMSLYPDLDNLSKASFDKLTEGVATSMPGQSQKNILIKSYSIWASVHGIVGILRRSELQGNKTETIEWITNNIEEYLKITNPR